jgi:hypothetical protein
MARRLAAVDVQGLAGDEGGPFEVLEELLAAGDRLGLYPRPYAVSVMFTPPTNRTRMLFTVWPDTGGMHLWVSADAFEEFFAETSADEARRQLGPAEQERLLDRRPESSSPGWSA